MKRVFDIILASTVIVLVTYFSFTTYKSAKELESVNKVYYEAQSDIGDLIKQKFNSMLSTLTFGAVKSKEKNAIDLNEITAKKIILKDKSIKDIEYLATIATIGLLLYFILDRYIYALMLSIVSIITLIFGVITPILLIVIHKNVNYLGDIVLSFESKTIIGTVEHLYNNSNYPVAIAILLFSIIVPLVKSLSMLFVLVWKRFHILNRVISFFKHLGKWSMLDVFIVSLLLVYLSVGSSQNSYSEIENGLYIFLIYVIYSIITSIVVDNIIIKTTK